jgi:hypothetical protein
VWAPAAWRAPHESQQQVSEVSELRAEIAALRAVIERQAESRGTFS